MDKQIISEGLNFCWDGQEFGQKLMESATTRRELDIATACKEAFRFMYYIFLDEKRKDKNKQLTEGENK